MERHQGHPYIESTMRTLLIPYSGYFSRGNFFVDMENFAGSWKTFRGYVYACTNGYGSLHLW